MTSKITMSPLELVSFDPDAFDEQIAGQGIRYVHYRALRSPAGMIGRDEDRRPKMEPNQASNGFYYIKGDCLWAITAFNASKKTHEAFGTWDGSTVAVTLPKTYENGQTLYASVFDRFYLADEAVLVVASELAEPVADGTMKAQYPIVQMIDVIDADGRVYATSDYTIQNGILVWTTENRPHFDAEKNRHVPCSIRYLYKPYWYLSQFIHEVRVARVESYAGQERPSVRMPPSALFQRENVFENKPNHSQTTEVKDGRFTALPQDGAFGPR